jgi:phosphoribosyl 1,2-cyclic phosphodiesterase
MMELCALASGSNGNCYYIGNEVDAILVDVGLSARKILIRIQEAGLDVSKIRGIVVSHEHSDHVRGVRMFSNKQGIPTWFSQGTLNVLPDKDKPDRTIVYKPGQSFRVASLIVHPFLKNHDAAEPCSFCIEHDDWNIGVFTDIGEPCEHVIRHLKKCHALFLETNYDEKMLWDGSYPYPLKRRIASSLGHLSNVQAFELIRDHAGPELMYVFLSHLSGENNTPEIAESCFKSLSNRFKICMTSRSTFSGFCQLR